MSYHFTQATWWLLALPMPAVIISSFIHYLLTLKRANHHD